jgi:trehalose 6-phosphate synthase/phosphatase
VKPETMEAMWHQIKRVINSRDPRVVIASNRLPITGVRELGRIRFRYSDGGLASGLRQVARSWPVRWYGWTGLASDAQEPQLFTSGDSSLIAIPLTADEIGGYYTDYSNSVLWPTLHGMKTDFEAGIDAWKRYVDVNTRFATEICKDLRSNDRIWIHDYHLLLLPQLLRRQADLENRIMFFLHTPFPSGDIFTKVPQHRQLLKGLLGADVIGFHTREYASAFLQAVLECGYQVSGDYIFADGRVVEVRVRPMGIDAEVFAHLGNDPSVLDEVSRLRSSERCLLLGVDRLDYTKGIPQRLLAFETLLLDRPELRGKVTLM